jgi:hypothetical protein
MGALPPTYSERERIMTVHTQHSSTVRTVSLGSPFENANDLIVEVLKDGEWTYYRGFNTFSNDYAYSSAREAAYEAIQGGK